MFHLDLPDVGPVQEPQELQTFGEGISSTRDAGTDASGTILLT